MNKPPVAFIFLILALLGLNGETEPSPRVLIKTDLGDIKVEIYEKQAPVTAANFLRYVDSGLFKGAGFGQVVDGMDIVRKIQRLPDREQMLKQPVRIMGVQRFSKNTKPT